MKNRHLLLVVVLLVFSVSVIAQNKIGDNPAVIHSGSLLELESLSKGLRLSRIQLNDVRVWTLDGTPTSGMMIFNETGAVPKGIYYWSTDAAQWVQVVNASSAPNGSTLPATGATGATYYNTTNGTLYVYNGATWDPLSTGGSTLGSATPPASPSAGDVYYNTTNHNMYYYNGTAWVMLNGVATGGTTPTGTGAVGETYYDTTTNTYYVSNGTAWNAVTATDATTLAKGVIQLTNDLGGTADLPTVPGLATKEPIITAGTTSQYFRGD